MYCIWGKAFGMQVQQDGRRGVFDIDLRVLAMVQKLLQRLCLCIYVHGFA